MIKPVNRQTLAATFRDVLEQKNEQKKGPMSDKNNELAYIHVTNRQKEPSHHVAPAASVEQERRQSRTATAQRRHSRMTSINLLSRIKQLQSSNRSPEDELREPARNENSQGEMLRFISSKSSSRRHHPPEFIRKISANSEDRSVKNSSRIQSMVVGDAVNGTPRHNQIAPQLPVSTAGDQAPSQHRKASAVINSLDDMDMEAIRMDVSQYMDVMLNLKGKLFNNREIRLEYKDFRRSNLNFKLGVVCLIITTIFVATRFSLENLWYLNSTFAFVFFCYCAFMLCIMISFFFKLVGTYSYEWPLLQRYHYAWLSYYNSGVAYIIDDGIIVFVSLATSFDMLARVLQGPCPVVLPPLHPSLLLFSFFSRPLFSLPSILLSFVIPTSLTLTYSIHDFILFLVHVMILGFFNVASTTMQSRSYCQCGTPRDIDIHDIFHHSMASVYQCIFTFFNCFQLVDCNRPIKHQFVSCEIQFVSMA